MSHHHAINPPKKIPTPSNESDRVDNHLIVVKVFEVILILSKEVKGRKAGDRRRKSSRKLQSGS